MRIPSGKTDQAIYFVAVDATDYVTRETGLSAFTVYRSRNGAAEVAYTTPTVTEIDTTNMPGVYALLIDEDTTIASGSDSEEYCLHITCTGMAPVTRTIELYRRDTTSGQTLTVASGNAAANVTQFGGSNGTFASGRPETNMTHIAGSAVSTTTAQIGVNAVQISGDSTAADNLETAFDQTAGSVPWMGITDQGTAQAAATGSITLRSAAAFADDALNGQIVYIQSATAGAGQVRRISDYVGSTDVATIEPNWATTPTGTIVYKIFADADTLPSWVRSAVGLATANLDSQFDATDILIGQRATPADIDTRADETDAFVTQTLAAAQNIQEVTDLLPDGGALTSLAQASALATVDGVVDAIKVTTDKLDDTLEDDSGTYRFTANALEEAPSGGGGGVTVDDIWDELTSGHLTPGTMGHALFSSAENAQQAVTDIAVVDGISDAIKAKTDSLTFTVAGQVDSNIQYVNDSEVSGAGTVGDPWGP